MQATYASVLLLWIAWTVERPTTPILALTASVCQHLLVDRDATKSIIHEAYLAVNCCERSRKGRALAEYEHNAKRALSVE